MPWVNADNVQLDRVLHRTAGDDQLLLEIAGNDGGLADNVDISVHTTGSVLMDGFTKSKQSTLNFYTNL